MAHSSPSARRVERRVVRRPGKHRSARLSSAHGHLARLDGLPLKRGHARPTTRSRRSRAVTRNEILASSRKTKQSYMWWGALCFAECRRRPGLLLKVLVPSGKFFCLSSPLVGSSLAFV